MILNGLTIGGLTTCTCTCMYCVDVNLKTSVDYIDWSDSMRDDLCMYCVDAIFTKPQWIILSGQTVGGLTVYCVQCSAYLKTLSGLLYYI